MANVQMFLQVFMVHCLTNVTVPNGHLVLFRFQWGNSGNGSSFHYSFGSNIYDSY